MNNQPSVSDPVGLLVLGMHRSGTSAVTGLLDQLGIPVSGELLGAESYNEKGLFENKAVNLFHERLLAHLGSRWDDPMPVSNQFVETHAGQAFVAELADIIRIELLSVAPIFAVKDPRMCRFVRLWRAALSKAETEGRAIIPLRHPLNVAASLASRDQFPRAKSLLLWLDHTLSAERQTRDLKRSFIEYDTLVTDWRSVVDKLAADLDLAWPKEWARVERTIDEFLSRDLRHRAHNAKIGERTRLDALVSRSWKALRSLLGDSDDTAARDTLDEVAAELHAATGVVSPYVAWEFHALRDARTEAERLALQEKALRQEREEFETALRGELEKAHADFRSQHDADWEAHQKALKTQQDELQRLTEEHEQELAAEQRAYRQTLEGYEQELAALRQAAERGSLFEQRTAQLEGETQQLRQALQEHQTALQAIHASTSWRLTAPLRSALGRLSPSVKAAMRRSAKAGWWAVTPWRLPARLAFIRDRNARLALAAGGVAPYQSSASPPPPPGPSPAAAPLASPARPVRRGSSPTPPLRVFEVPDGGLRLSMVTDSINEGSLFGGVATALIFSALLAKRMKRRLRIVTRTQAPATENVATVFRAHGIDWGDNIDFAFADICDEASQVDVHPDELFVTTSWWTTESTRQSIPFDQMLYILQEDERMFYPFGDDYLACSETIGDHRIRRVINSELLHRHLKTGGVIDDKTPFFEPSFPDRIYYPEPATKEGKRNFFFYARPYNNVRNLYDRGVAVIEAAIERGILDPSAWDIHFVGKDLAPMTLTGGIEPILLQNLPWEDYAAYVRSVDLALTLMYTPHPSYPPLDVAACGGVAVTNSFGVKTDLTRYSRSIICVDSKVDALVEGLRLGVERALDYPGRKKALKESHIKRDWKRSFAPVFKTLEDAGLVR